MLDLGFRLLLAVSLAGCLAPIDDAGDTEPTETTTDQEIQAGNGTSLNGTSLNGTSLNGTSLSGASLLYATFASATQSGTALTSVALTGSTLTAKKGTTNLTGAGMVGSLFVAQATNGAAMTVRIDGVHALAAPNADVTAYVLSYQTASGFVPLCSNAGNAANEAIAIPGGWNLTTGAHVNDATKFTFGCRAATFAKCVELGYKPWLTVAGSGLGAHLEACTRALRADYCGTGVSNTVDGTQINIYDSLGVQADSLAWKIEANWTAAGATCLATPRVLTNLAKGAVPDCVYNRAQVACSTSSWTGVLLRTEVNK